jgi:hypothetical protein
MSALGHKRTSTTTGLRQMRRPQERASTLMGDNPRRYGFNDSLDELPPCNAACEIGPTLWLLQPQDEPPQGTMRKRRFVYPAVYPSARLPPIRCPLYPRKRTLIDNFGMSAKGQLAQCLLWALGGRSTQG